jgi:hypothetical protein
MSDPARDKSEKKFVFESEHTKWRQSESFARAVVRHKKSRHFYGGSSAVDAASNDNGRDDWIRTSDLTHPKRARYQAAPHPVRKR